MGVSPHIKLSPELEQIMIKAMEPDPSKVDPMVEWAQKMVKALAYNEEAWETLFGGLPTI